MKTIAIACVSVTGLLAGAACAQQAVQWRLEDGGNGHWYGLRLFQSPTSRASASELAFGSGASLACLESELENHWVASTYASSIGLPMGQAWIGGSLVKGVWRWETGAAVEPFAWNCDHCHPSCQPDLVCENFLTIMCVADGVARFNNAGDGCLGEGQVQALFEWSADCNDDGIVDYGQIVSGYSPDTNGNGVPDACDPDCNANGLPDHDETASGRAFDLNANQIPDACDSEDATPVLRSIVAQRGPACGYWIAAPLSGVWDLWVSRTSPTGPWVNGAAAPGASILLEAQLAPGANTLYLRHDMNGCYSAVWGLGLWFADTLAPAISVTPTTPCEPYFDLMNSQQGGVETTGSGRVSATVGTWEIEALSYTVTTTSDMVGEEALRPSGRDDLLGVLVLNVSRSCPGDVDDSGVVNGVDLAALLNVWGTDGGKYPGADTNNDGIVNGIDLATVLSGWGACPQ